jgi:transcription initiation factor TFIIB
MSSSCGIVLRDKVEGSPDLRKCSQDDIESRSRTGMPTSLAFHDMGLSTFISYSNVDASGVRINSEQVNKVRSTREILRRGGVQAL